MKDHEVAEKYKRYVGGIWTWLPIICGLAMAMNAATVNFSLKAHILNNLFGPLVGHAMYLLVGLLLIALGLGHALGFPREHKKVLTAERAFAKRMKEHRG